MHLFNVAPHLNAELDLSMMEGEPKKTGMLQPTRQTQAFKQILSLLGVYGDVSSEVCRERQFSHCTSEMTRRCLGT